MRDARENSSFIFVVMATLLVVTAIASFAPTSLALIARVSSGQQPAPPPVVHFHAASMSLWLLLLLTQSVLVSKQRIDLHRKLGLVSLILAPCILVSMYGMDLYGVETFDVETTVVTSGVAPPEPVEQLKRYASSILLIHGASYLLFPAFYIWAILVRRRDNESHKRLMILATLVLMIPGLGRLLSITAVLPDFGLSIIDARHFYLLALIAPALAYDTVKRRAPHRSYTVGVALLVAWIITAHYLWAFPWWVENSPKLLGIA
ncbi:MAG: hypothetical protein ACR2QQ_08620 [Gammaproteobacteria bacterium]